MALAMAILGWSFAVAFCLIAAAFRHNANLACKALDAARSYIKTLEAQDTEWNRACGNHAHRAVKLQQALIDVIRDARVVLEEVNTKEPTDD